MHGSCKRCCAAVQKRLRKCETGGVSRLKKERMKKAPPCGGAGRSATNVAEAQVNGVVGLPSF